MNLSSVSLTPSQIQVLSEGLKITTTPQHNLPEVERDVKYFTRKLRLVEFFSENPELDTPDSPLVKNKSNLCPPQNPKSTLVCVIIFKKKQSFSEGNFKNKSNISKHECQDILILRKNKDIITQEAEKSEAVVIMNTKHYLKIISYYLSNETT